jgi:hypothetical protein
VKTGTVNLTSILSRDKTKLYWYFEYGRGKGQRVAYNLYTWASTKTLIEKKHNKDVENLLETEQAQRILDLKTGKGPEVMRTQVYNNFLDYFQEWVNKNAREGNRHAQGCLKIFTEFAGKEFRDLAIKSKDGKLILPAACITEEVCLRFRWYLTDDVRVKTKTGEIIVKPPLNRRYSNELLLTFQKDDESCKKSRVLSGKSGRRCCG